MPDFTTEESTPAEERRSPPERASPLWRNREDRENAMNAARARLLDILERKEEMPPECPFWLRTGLDCLTDERREKLAHFGRSELVKHVLATGIDIALGWRSAHEFLDIPPEKFPEGFTYNDLVRELAVPEAPETVNDSESESKPLGSVDHRHFLATAVAVLMRSVTPVQQELAPYAFDALRPHRPAQHRPRR